MKLTALMAGVAALSLIAGGASAQTVLASSPGGSQLTQTAVTAAASNGTANTPAGATFNLSASVAKDCSFYTGGGDVDIDFGTVGIYNTSTAGLTNAFTMTGAMNTSVETSVAGCNFDNTMRIQKTNGAPGLLNGAPGNYDATQFQANIPYRVVLNFTAPEAGSNTAAATRLRTITTEGSKQRSFGAWKSAMRIDFEVPAAALALVAGDYTDTVDVTITAL